MQTSSMAHSSGQPSVAAHVAEVEARRAELLAQVAPILKEIERLDSVLAKVLNDLACAAPVGTPRPEPAATRPARTPRARAKATPPAEPVQLQSSEAAARKRRISGASLGVLVWMSKDPERLYSNADLREIWRMDNGSEQKILKRLHRDYGLVDQPKDRKFRINDAGLERARIALTTKESFPLPPT